MKLKREEFDILARGQKSSGGGGSSIKGVKIIGDQEDKQDSKPGQEGQDKPGQEGQDKPGPGQDGQDKSGPGQDGQDNQGGKPGEDQSQSSDGQSGGGGSGGGVQKSWDGVTDIKTSGKVLVVRGKAGIGKVISPREGKELQEEIAETTGEIIDVRTVSKELTEKLKEKAVRARGKAKEGGAIRRMLDELATPQVNWRKELKRFIGRALEKQEYFIGARRHLWRKGYITGVRKDREDSIDTAIIVVDTSASIGDDELKVFMTEALSAIEEKQIPKTLIIYHHHDVWGTQEIKYKGKGRAKWKPLQMQTGGTTFQAVIDYIDNYYKKKPGLVLWCTDGGDSGYSKPKGKWDKNLLWLIVDNFGWKKEFGKKAIFIKAKDLS